MGVRTLKHILLIACLLGLSICQDSDSPEIVTKVATSAANWLKLESGTRAIGMGGANVAAGEGVSSIPYNPASVGFIQGSQFYYSKSNYYLRY